MTLTERLARLEDELLRLKELVYTELAKRKPPTWEQAPSKVDASQTAAHPFFAKAPHE